MENKKLIKILLKDIGELEELIGEVKAGKRFDALEMEFIHTRTKGLQQLLQLLNTPNAGEHPDFISEQEKVEELKESVEKVSQKSEGISREKRENQGEKTQSEFEKEAALPEEHNSEWDTANEDSYEPPENEEKVDDFPGDLPKRDPGARLGDSFLKGKSVNDLITDQHKLEYKLSNRPVSSIQAAIGINDRFQYIRELFDGDSEKFLNTVKTLDAMQDIQEAVEYLRTHFKWKKNETSLKFVNLVKRRFQNGRY